MPRPKNKPELITASSKNFKQLVDHVEGLDKEKIETEFSGDTLNRNVRDVFMHLHIWHKMLLNWYIVGMKGGKPDMPAKGYTWQTMPELNKEIWKQSQEVNLAKAKTLLMGSHKKLQSMISNHSDKELFTKKKYAWTGSTSLAQYLISNTSSHYAWAFKLIKKNLK